MGDGWKKKSKGNAKIHIHEGVANNRAIVENHNGITFNGKKFVSLDAAKAEALKQEVV